MKVIICLFFSLFVVVGFSQNKNIEKTKAKTLKIAYELYKSELASWNSTDILYESFSNRMNEIGGYLSYTVGENTIAIYYDKTEDKNVIFSVTYPEIVIFKNKFEIDTIVRNPNPKELRLIAARDKSRDIAYTNDSKVFSFYEKTSYNFIPIIYDHKIIVYSLTAPTTGTSVLIGNDYKFEFDKKDRFKKVNKIHNTLFYYPYKAKEGQSTIKSITHSHIIEDYLIISETDICTLLLYKDYVEWDTCSVISKEYVSFWNMEKEELVVLTRKAWDKIANAQTEN